MGARRSPRPHRTRAMAPGPVTPARPRHRPGRRQGAGSLLDAQLAVGIVGGVRVAGGVERGGLGGGQVQPGRAKVGLELANRTGAEDGRADRGPAGHPRQRDLGHGHAAVLGDFLHGVDDVPGAVGAAPVVRFHAALRILAEAGRSCRALVAPVLAGQPAAAERAPRQQAQADVDRGRHDLPLDLPGQQAVLRLEGHRPGHVQGAGQMHRLGQLPAGEVGQPPVADLAGPDELLQRPQGLLQRRQRVVRVNLIQVNRLEPQPMQRGIQRAGQVARRQPGAVRRVIHRHTALGGQHHGLGDIGRAACEPAADDLLRPPAAVHVRRVHHRATGLDEAVELLVRPALVRLGTERHRPQAQARHRAAAASQHAIVHKATLPRPGAPQKPLVRSGHSKTERIPGWPRQPRAGQRAAASWFPSS